MASGMRLILPVAVVLVSVALSGCATTHMYAMSNGRNAYEVQCTLWYQCTEQAAKTCPHGYRLVKGPHSPQPMLPNGNVMQGSSRIDFVCNH